MGLKKNNKFNIYFTLFFFVHVEAVFHNLFLYSYNINFLKFVELLPEVTFRYIA